MNILGKKVLVVAGSLLATEDVKKALEAVEATVTVTSNLISAFNLIDKTKFDGAVIDYSLHNEAVDLFSELRSLRIPHVSCSEPHRLQGLEGRRGAARQIVAKLGRLISEDARPDVDEGVLLQFLRSRGGKTRGGFGEPQRGR